MSPIGEKSFNFDGPNKKIRREQAVKDEQSKVYGSAMFLAGYKCHDVRRAFENGIINSDTFIIVVEGYYCAKYSCEKNEQIRNEIIDHQRKLLAPYHFKNIHFHNDLLHKLDLKEIVEKYGPVEYAFFDLCGMLTDDVINWLTYCRNNLYFARDMRMVFTTVHEIQTCGSDYHKALIDVQFKNNPLKMRINRLDFDGDEGRKMLNDIVRDYFYNASSKYKYLMEYVDRIFFGLMENRGMIYYIDEYSDKNEKSEEDGKKMLFMDVSCDWNIDKIMYDKYLNMRVEDKINGIECDNILTEEEMMKKASSDAIRKAAQKLVDETMEAARVQAEGATGRSKGAIMFNAVRRANKVRATYGIPVEVNSNK